MLCTNRVSNKQNAILKVFGLASYPSMEYLDPYPIIMFSIYFHRLILGSFAGTGRGEDSQDPSKVAPYYTNTCL